MARTFTRYVNMHRLTARGIGGATVVKLMLACNDLQLVNEALTDWKKEQPKSRQFRQSGAGMYFLRIQLAHLFEGLNIVEQIRDDFMLRAVVDRCDSQTRESFAKLLPFLSDGAQRPEVERVVGRVRHTLAFHYETNGKLVAKAIADRASRSATPCSITRGSTSYLWRFHLADDVVDTVVVRRLWGAQDTDPRVEADKVADFTHEIFLPFVDFAGEFIWKYCEDLV